MATKLFFRSAVSDYGTGNNDLDDNGTATGWDALSLSTTAGAGATSAVAGCAGVTRSTIGSSGGNIRKVWYSPPLDADITISGSITWNLRAAEDVMTVNAAINARLEVIDGATGTRTLVDQTARTAELGTAEAAVNFAETPAAGVACKRGDRLRITVFAAELAGGTMGSGTCTLWYNGPTAAATGDSYVTLTENLTFASEPAGTTIYPTDTASAVSTASVDREAWTSRGAGYQTDITNPVTGWTAPIQTRSGGTGTGTVVDWFTRPLTAFTLGGAVRVNVNADEDGSSVNASIRCEIARVEGDGTSPTVWGATTSGSELGTLTGAGFPSFLVGGDDLAISDGQRLRIRFYIDDSPGAAMAAGAAKVNLYYAGTTAAATGDTYLTFTQTLTEYVAQDRPPVGVRRNYHQITSH